VSERAQPTGAARAVHVARLQDPFGPFRARHHDHRGRLRSRRPACPITPLAGQGQVGVAGPGCRVAAATVVPLTGSEAVADESQAERVKARYKETDHVKNYYRVNRY